jgi:hypothetical protein
MIRNANLPANRPLQASGDIIESFREAANIISRNGGVRSFSIAENNCFDMACPFDTTRKTNVSLTSVMHDINQLGDSFINMKCVARTRSSKGFSAGSGFQNCMRIFQGFKNSAEFVKQTEIFNKGNTGYANQYCVEENFAYATYKARPTKYVNKFKHSLYENVIRYDNSICGAYIDPTVAWPTPNSVADIHYAIAIPINDFLALQIFDDWPMLYGDIVLRLQFTKSSQVFAQVDPHEVAKVENFINESITDENLNRVLNTPFKYDRKFIQNQLKGNFITNVTANSDGGCNYTVEEVIFEVDEITVNDMRVTIPGYRCNDATKKALAEAFPIDNPWYIPSQQIEPLSMPKPNNQFSYDGSMSFVLNNVTDFILIFRKDGREFTCFENPMINGLQIIVENKNMPENPLCTIGEHFFSLVLQASDLDNLFEATEEYEHSLTKPLNNPDGTPILRTLMDQTSFIPPIQAERSGRGYFFDGMETGSKPANIRLKFTPIYQGPNDTYLFHNPPAPQMWLCRDTFFTFDTTNGLRYHSTGTPAKFASDVDFQNSVIATSPQLV